jgi:hypothetical protein
VSTSSVPSSIRLSFRRRLPLLLLIPVGAALQLMAARWPGLADLYAGAVYPAVSRLYAGLTGWIPFSVAEIVVVALALRLVVRGVRNLQRVRRGDLRARDLLLGFELSALSWLAVAYALFVVWGLNYQRTPLAAFARYDTRPPEVSELRALGERLIDDANAFREEVEEDGDGVMRLRSGRGEALLRAREGFDRLRVAAPDLVRGRAGRAKGLHLFATPMSILGADGIFLMWTGEPSVNMNLPDPALPWSACHEIAHQVGWAREDEASFVGYLACAGHPEADFRYGAALGALRYALSALARVDPEGARTLSERLDPGVRRDREALAAYSRRYRSRVQDAAGATYDVYLESQGQKEGRASYGKVVDLLLAYRRTLEGTAP